MTDMNPLPDDEAREIDRQAVIIARAMLGQMPADGGSPLLLITAFINAAGNLYMMMNPPPGARVAFRAMFEEGIAKALDTAEAHMDRADSGLSH